ncbi:MAG TPA: hypothetical protein VET48_15165 [Steroidobacteraceae bacterium]|nr:hypothetical protein [Steroidobacteraceae bacterium]
MQKQFRFIATTIAALATAPTFAGDTSAPIRVDAGAGVGIHYGLIGANAELFFTDQFSFSAGAGRGYEFAYDLALHYYLVADPHRWRPRLSIDYGTFDQANTTPSSGSGYFNWGTSGTRSYETVSVGLGVSKLWGRKNSNGFAFDINYSSENKVETVYVMPSLGYVHRF